MMRSGRDEALAPKYAHVERERRWLIDPARLPDLSDAPFTLIEDRYIHDTRLRLRRMTDTRTGAASLKLTKKYETAEPLARPIVTAYLTEAEFEVFAQLPALPLAKRRYALTTDDVMFSVDLFEDRLAPLALGEIEAGDDAGLRALHAPAGAIRDVSDDPRYQGAALAADGIPEERPWPLS